MLMKLFRATGLAWLVMLFVNLPAAMAGQQEALGFSQALEQLLTALPKGSRLAFVEPSNSQGQKSRLAAEMFHLWEPLAVELGKKQGIQFVERRDLQLIIDEWKLNMAGITSGDAGVRSLLDADYLLIAKVGLAEKELRSSLKLSSLANGQVLAMVNVVQPAQPSYYRWQASDEAASLQGPGKTNVAVSRDKKLQLWTDAPSYELGETITIFFQVSEPLYVKIIDVTPAGDITTIFPNPFQPDNFCQPGKRYQIPPQGADFALEVTPPTGTDRLKAIASPKPLPDQDSSASRGIAFTKKLVKASKTRASIAFEIF